MLATSTNRDKTMVLQNEGKGLVFDNEENRETI